jgi:hypothetical protein
VHIIDDEDITLMNLTKSERIAQERIQKSLRDLTNRLDDMDAKIADIKDGLFADLEKMAANNKTTVAYWDRHNERLK